MPQQPVEHRYAALFVSAGIPDTWGIVAALRSGEPSPAHLFHALYEAAHHHSRDAYLLGRDLAIVEGLPRLVNIAVAIYRDRSRHAFAAQEPVMGFCLGVEYQDVELIESSRRQLVSQDPFLGYIVGRLHLDAGFAQHGSLYNAASHAIADDASLHYLGALLAFRYEDTPLMQRIRERQGRGNRPSIDSLCALKAHVPPSLHGKRLQRRAMDLLVPSLVRIQSRPPSRRPSEKSLDHLAALHALPLEQVSRLYTG
ncbi:MAG: hypothetical protein Q7S65_04245 [Nanoarchaeota archaeon]|nr:hypothetical protein [Nanoarchaeota archaeon]